MIRSMTGYGEALAEIHGVHYAVSLRSLNNKYLKAIIRLPDEFQPLEAELESVLRKKLSRGTVTFTGTCTDTSESAAFEINHNALERYIEQIRLAPLVAMGQVSIDVASLLNLPGVLQPPSNEDSRLENARSAFIKLAETACVSLIKMRHREGKMLQDDLFKQRNLLTERLSAISEIAPAIVAEYEKRLHGRIQTMLDAAEIRVEAVDIIREVAAYAERTDIAEEITRLRGHIEQFTEFLESSENRPLGRTMDFLAQEMLREANTIASKSPDVSISRHIVEIKGAIDRIKEQVQNVE